MASNYKITPMSGTTSQKNCNISTSASLTNILSTTQSGLGRKCARLNPNYNDVPKKISKTSNKITPLKLMSSKKTITPQGNILLNDRYIPCRVNSNLEMSYHLIHSKNAPVSGKPSSEASSPERKPTSQIDVIKRKLLADTCNGVPEKAKILSLRSKPIEMLDAPVIETMKASYSSSSLYTSLPKTSTRVIDTFSEKILDAPDFRNDYYLNLLDWSSTNIVAVALDRDMYVWNHETGEISTLFTLEEGPFDYISSLSWIQNRDNVLAVGTSKYEVELWDVNAKTCIRKMKSHTSRVGALAWNLHILTSGSRSGDIHLHDVRVSRHHVGTVKLHDQEVCGLKWSPDGRYLASGANDNLAAVWDGYMMSSGENSQPLHVIRKHRAAVKALGWCPWQSHILATGGGTADRKINIWNIKNGNLLSSHDAQSQISCLLWSKTYKEIITSHGFEMNQMTIWKYPDMSKVCDLYGHTNRILMMCMSPDEQVVASVGADETLRIWKCFEFDSKLKKKDTINEKSSLEQFIR